MPILNPILNPDLVQSRLSAAWLFVLLNYIYCDVLTHMDAEALKALLTGIAGNIHLTQGFLLGASIYMEIPIAMVLLSRILPYGTARWACVAAAILMTLGQSASLFMGTGPTPYYIFFSVIEIAGTAFIAFYAWSRPLASPKQAAIPQPIPTSVP